MGILIDGTSRAFWKDSTVKLEDAKDMVVLSIICPVVFKAKIEQRFMNGMASSL